MSPKQNTLISSEPLKMKLYRVGVLCFTLALFGGALAIAFVYESQTLWYKVGSDKIMLRTGQIFGLIAAVLFFLQIALAIRNEFLINLFGLAAVMRWHRFNGLLIAFCAVCHVVLVLVPEGLTNFPIGKEFWPEMVGMLLFWIILSMVISSHFRQRLGLNYLRWKSIHRSLGYLSSAIVVIHILFVSDSFQHFVPKTALLLLYLFLFSLVVWTKKGGGKA